MYHIVDWDTNKTLQTVESLQEAKRACRACGSVPSDLSTTGYMAVAYVGQIIDGVMCCVYRYTPRAPRGV